MKLIHPLIPIAILGLALTNCGKQEESDLDIVGGTLVEAGDQSPERMSTVAVNGCTGTIIAKDLILTAAHCVPANNQFRPNSNAARFTLRERDASQNRGTLIPVVGQVRHPQWRGTPTDIALLKLASNIPSTHRVMDILETAGPVANRKPVVQAGYGKTNGNDPVSNAPRVLRRVDSFVRSHFQSGQGGTINVSNGRTAACSGDSGGPLYSKIGDKWYTVGVTSTAAAAPGSRPGNLVCSGGNSYASIPYNLDWLISAAKTLTAGDTGRNGLFDDGGLGYNKGGDAPEVEPETPEVEPTPDITPKPEPKPDTPAPDNDGEATFQILAGPQYSSGYVSYQVQNISNRSVARCVFMLDIQRRNSGTYSLRVAPQGSIEDQQEVVLNFYDWRSSWSFWFGSIVGEPKLSKTCAD